MGNEQNFSKTAEGLKMLRPARPADLDAVLSLLTAARLPVQGVQEGFNDGYAVVEYKGAITGVAGIEIHGRLGLLRSVVIDPACRSAGLGGTLLRDRLAWAESRGLDETERLLKFFAANIRNPNTRGAYVRAVREFFRWTAARGISLTAIRPIHIANYMEGLSGAAQSLKQKLAAIRMLFDWLVTGRILPTNPTADARSSRHVVKVGKTSVLTAQEAQALLLVARVRAGLRRAQGPTRKEEEELNSKIEAGDFRINLLTRLGNCAGARGTADPEGI
jgi:N-acetylglutamate synthase-like GNAT family acetyltransferase